MKTTRNIQLILNKTSNPLVKRARYEALLLAKEKGTTNTRAVRQVMRDKDLIPEHIDDRWLGGVFPKCKLFEDTGETIEVADEERNIHKGRDSKVWRIAPDFRGVELPDAPTDDLSDYFAQRTSHVDKLLRHAAYTLKSGYAIHVGPAGTILIDTGDKTVRHTTLEGALVELIGEEQMP